MSCQKVLCINIFPTSNKRLHIQMTDIGVKIKINIILPNDSDSWINNKARNLDLIHIDISSYLNRKYILFLIDEIEFKCFMLFFLIVGLKAFYYWNYIFICTSIKRIWLIKWHWICLFLFRIILRHTPTSTHTFSFTKILT